MSGWHVMAVSTDGPEVRQSPVLELHDGKELKEGVLLLLHLLSPTFTVVKAPWRTEPIHQPDNVSSALPEDVLRQIAHFTDLETYLSLHLVSRYVRLICLAHPRVGDHILLSYEPTTKSRLTFRVRDTRSTYSTLATPTRTKFSEEEPSPIWRFRRKNYSKCVLNPGLSGTFQYHQSGIGPLDASLEEEYNSKPPQYFLQNLPFREMIQRDKFHDSRIQTIDGIWEMVTEKSTPRTELKEEPETWGIRLPERMTGFDTDDFRDLSEAEKFEWLSDSSGDHDS